MATGDDADKFSELTMLTSVKWYEIPPTQKRTQLLKECHGNFHIGAKAMLAQFHSQITWNKIQLDVYNYCKLCEQCQRKNGVARSSTPFRVVVADRPLQHLYIDLSFMIANRLDIGVVNLIDHFTKKLWTKVIQSKSASVVVGFLEEVFLSVGLIEVDNITDSNDFITFLRSDNGTEFVAKDVKGCLCQV